LNGKETSMRACAVCDAKENDGGIVLAFSKPATSLAEVPKVSKEKYVCSTCVRRISGTACHEAFRAGKKG